MIIRRRISAAEFVRMDKAGVFAPGERLELLDGEIHTMSPIGPRHAYLVNMLIRLLNRQCGERWMVSAQNPISLGPNDLPQPDIAIIRALDWSQQHPGAGDIALVVEVADSSREFDLGEKRLYYATRGIAELWILDLVENRVEISTGPSFRGYANNRVVGHGETAICQAVPEVAIAVSALFPGPTP